MSVDLFDEDELLRLAMETVEKGGLHYAKDGTPFFLYRDTKVTALPNGEAAIETWVGDYPERTISWNKHLHDMIDERLYEGVDEAARFVAEEGFVPPIKQFTAENKEMIEKARNLAKALDISPTAAHRLIEMKTTYELPQEHHGEDFDRN